MCTSHRRRAYAYGDPLKRLKAPAGSGWLRYGYRLFYKDGKRVFEHRLVMEAHLGRKLQDGEIIHHINGDRLDNRVENLQIMTRSEHIKLHRKIEKERRNNQL
jgi:hypothetical protein